MNVAYLTLTLKDEVILLSNWKTTACKREITMLVYRNLSVPNFGTCTWLTRLVSLYSKKICLYLNKGKHIVMRVIIR